MSTNNEVAAMRLALEALKFEDSGDPECEHGFMYDECPNDKCDKRRFHKAIKAIEAALEAHKALAQQEQSVSVSAEHVGEPVAWMHKQGNHEEPSFRQLDDWEISNGWEQYPLYNTPHQRTWIGLTDEQIKAIADKYTVNMAPVNEELELAIELNDSCQSVHSFARAIEAAHGITKENT